MKLHEAIEKVLKDENHPMTAAEITEKIKRCIYHNILRAGIFFVFSFWMLSCCDSGVPKIELTRFEDISTERQVSIRKSVMKVMNLKILLFGIIGMEFQLFLMIHRMLGKYVVGRELIRERKK